MLDAAVLASDTEQRDGEWLGVIQLSIFPRGCRRCPSGCRVAIQRRWNYNHERCRLSILERLQLLNIRFQGESTKMGVHTCLLEYIELKLLE